MKILIIGAEGTVGLPITQYFEQEHQVIRAGRSSGDVQLDIADTASIQKALDTAGQVDAIICIAGEAKWAAFDELSEEDYYIGIRSKLMGQVNLVRLGKEKLNPGGSITLSTGILADDPVLFTSSAAMVNGGIHSFVQAASLEMPNGLRLNVVSLGMVEKAYEKYKGYFPGHNPVPTSKTINAYARAVLGKVNGEIIRVYE
jgi:NAD(P)-dependent dehydrogenase (short-subunit alcohol dehydrogenase family)